MLVNWIRFFLFMAVLGVVALLALVNWERSDKDVIRALEQGAEHARRDALAIGRGTSEALAQTGEAINKRSREIRAETEQARQQLNEAGREQRQELAEQKEALSEQVEQLGADALSWKDKVLAQLRDAAARVRAWFTAESDT